MEFPWGILIALTVLGLALLIQHFANEVVEEDHHFWGILFVFLVIYVAAAFGIGYVSPRYSALASVEPDAETVSLNDIDSVTPPGPFAQFLDRIKIKNVLP